MTSLPSDRARPIWGGQISHADNEAGRNKCVFINGKGAINHVLLAPVTVVMNSFKIYIRYILLVVLIMTVKLRLNIFMCHYIILIG